MLTAKEIHEALREFDPTVAIWVLSEVVDGKPWNAERLLLSHLPQARWAWGRELVASLNREHVMREAASC